MIQPSATLLWSTSQKVLPKKNRLVRAPDKTQQGGGHIQRPAELSYPARRLDYRRSRDQQGNFVGVNWNTLSAIYASAVICHDCEDRIGPKGLFPGGSKELSQRVVAVFDRVVTALFV